MTETIKRKHFSFEVVYILGLVRSTVDNKKRLSTVVTRRKTKKSQPHQTAGQPISSLTHCARTCNVS